MSPLGPDWCLYDSRRDPDFLTPSLSKDLDSSLSGHPVRRNFPSYPEDWSSLFSHIHVNLPVYLLYTVRGVYDNGWVQLIYQ